VINFLTSSSAQVKRNMRFPTPVKILALVFSRLLTGRAALNLTFLSAADAEYAALLLFPL